MKPARLTPQAVQIASGLTGEGFLAQETVYMHATLAMSGAFRGQVSQNLRTMFTVRLRSPLFTFLSLLLSKLTRPHKTSKPQHAPISRPRGSTWGATTRTSTTISTRRTASSAALERASRTVFMCAFPLSIISFLYPSIARPTSTTLGHRASYLDPALIEPHLPLYRLSSEMKSVTEDHSYSLPA